MQKITALLSLLFMILLGTLHAQVPQRFNYQGIARDAKGNPMAGQALRLKIALLPAADAPEAEYEEMQTVSTNAFGLYTLQIGNGTPTKGEMNAVKWESGNKYIRVAIDPKGGTDFADAGTTQLLSVPYALYADRAGLAKSGGDRTGAVSSNAAHVAGDANYLTKFTALNVIGKSLIFDNGTNVGIGTTAPASTASLHIQRNTSGQYLYLSNPDTIGFGSIRLYNDVPGNFATFTKYGSKRTGGYAGIQALYSYANALGFGNNGGAMLNASTGNIGFAITKSGINKLKIHIDAASERVGLGGNVSPEAPVHISNTNGVSDTLKFTNNTTGHTSNDGFEIRTNGNTARLTNRENAGLVLGTNNTDRLAITGSGNVGIGTNAPTVKLDVNGQVRIQGGSPGQGKILMSDANGVASWQMQIQPVFQNHYIGEHYGGGVVFHLWLDSLGIEHGLIVDTADLGTSVWSNVSIIDSATLSTWNGLDNSYAIIAQVGHTNSAAALCLNSSNGGYSDWYLPAIDELVLLFNNRFNVNRTLSSISGAKTMHTNGPNRRYWSSSTITISADHAFRYYWNDGDGPAPDYKAGPLLVRAVRQF